MVFIPRPAALCLLGFAALAQAQTPPADLTHCADPNADTSITACSTLIASPAQSALPDATLAKAFTYRGFSYLKKNQYTLAIEDFTHAIRLDPENAWALANRGNAYFNTRQPDLAMKDYDEALRLNPVGYATLFYGRGAILSGQGESEGAIEQFDEAIRLQPEFPEAFNNRGIAHFNNAQFSRAIDDYTQALHFRPNYASALLNRGNAWAAKSQYDHAIEDYGKAIALQSTPTALRNRGNAYRAKGDYEKALADLTGSLDDRGDVYLELGQAARALEDFSEAIRLQPDDPDVFQRRAQAEFNLSQWNEAVADFQKSLSLDPSNPYAFIWLHLANARAEKDDAGSLGKQAADLHPAAWPGPIIDLFLGKLRPAYVIAFASDPDPDKTQSQQCEAHFYVGEYILTQPDMSSAPEHLQEARRLCSGIFAESLAAKMELKRLETAPK